MFFKLSAEISLVNLVYHKNQKLLRISPEERPQMPCRSSYNLHKKAGGSPKFCFIASNIRKSREACNPQIHVGIPYKRCGFNGS